MLVNPQTFDELMRILHELAETHEIHVTEYGYTHRPPTIGADELVVKLVALRKPKG